MEFKYVVVVACILLVLFLCYKEWKRNNRSSLLWRVVASVLMVLSFALLLIPITYKVKKVALSHQLKLVTEGTPVDTIANIAGQKYTLDTVLFAAQKNLKVKPIADLAYHLQANPSIKNVHIYGYGLRPNELALLKGYQVSFHPARVPSGIISASWPKKIKTTESLQLQGVYHNPSNKAVQLQLVGMGLVLDSVIIKAKSQINFSFNTQPKQFGKAVYHLVALQKNDTLSVEPVPFEVKGKEQGVVLILASFPDFEYKFLKKWLYENQYPVIFRSQISKDKFSVDFLNTKTVDIHRVSGALLKQVAVLIIDEDEFSAISASDRAAIDAAVNEGMGLIVRLTNAKASGSSERFKRVEISDPKVKTLGIHGVDDQFKFSELPFQQTLFLAPGSSDQPLFKSLQRRTVVNTQINGMGKVLVSSVSTTYQWELAGKKIDYANFWSILLAKAAKKKVENQSFELAPTFLTVGAQASLLLSMGDSKLPSMQLNDLKLAPMQNMELPFKWEGTFWATQPGWNTLMLNGQTEEIFIYQKSDWSGMSKFDRLNQTAGFVVNEINMVVSAAETEYLASEEFSKWWFFAVFLLSASFLWYEQRFLANK